MLVASPVVSSSASSRESKTNELFPKCLRTRQVTYPFSNLASSKSALDYHELRRLQEMSSESDDREETHNMFMRQYVSVLKPEPKKCWTPRIKITRTAISDVQPSSMEMQSSSVSSSQLSTRRSRKENTPFQRDILILRRLLRKLHIQRTNAEHEQIFQIMTQFPQFMAIDQRPKLLRQAIEIAHFEICDDIRQPVLPSNGFFLILKGGVSPPPVTSEFPSLVHQIPMGTLTVGKCFGSLKPSPEGQLKSPWYVTAEENCEFLKIDKDEFATIKTKFEQTEYQEKYSLIRSCGEYKMWTKQPTDEVVRVIEWIEYPQNTILASEGFRCPFIAYVKTGECHILRKVDVVKTAHNGIKSRQLRQVVMGKINSPDSFGEISVLLQEAMTCTVVTATHCVLGIVRPGKTLELPEVTRKLLLHTAQRTFAHLSQDDIRREYINQETRKEWTDFKKDILDDIIFKKNIRAGQGKWQHSTPIPTPADDRQTKSSMH
ncbi:unnamed protein product [Rotaria socialis]|uniref:Cyclic nucleotide-binding domain-containing protein n=1 Tax=Rotaria socialis TaxID=392032 RepID=A0A818GSU7_9BILA|nr:unnamed protein product [Rotaria socialis]CAF3411007.1 unnamed protein product [Rotaria socialis]CAF3495317.1 unnamed protein product [Rotaria socialis]